MAFLYEALVLLVAQLSLHSVAGLTLTLYLVDDFHTTTHGCGGLAINVLGWCTNDALLIS